MKTVENGELKIESGRNNFQLSITKGRWTEPAEVLGNKEVGGGFKT